MRPILAALCLTLAPSLAVAGCGGGSATDTAPNALDIPPGHRSLLVIDQWVETLSRGDVADAADFFALPSVVQNGTPPVRIATRADAVDFNRSLPCGAKLVRARPLGRFIAATFRLSERPGPGTCGPGVGGLARTAFLIRDDKIVQWRRLPDVRPQAPSGEPT